MLLRRAFRSIRLPLTVLSLIVLVARAQAQEPARSPAATESKAGSEENPVPAEKPERDDLNDEIEAVKAESAAVRELLRKMQEQQKTLLERIDRLPALTNTPAQTDPAGTSEQSASIAEALKKSGRYN